MALISPPPSPILTHQRICEALLGDEETPCKQRLRSANARFCQTHGQEYRQLTKAYKDASELVAVLRNQAPLTTDALRALGTAVAVHSALAIVEGWRDAVEEEINGRKTHHRRFFRTKHDGHERWLERLSRDHARAEGILARLRTRRVTVSVLEDERRRWRGSSDQRIRTPSSTVDTPYAARHVVVHPRFAPARGAAGQEYPGVDGYNRGIFPGVNIPEDASKERTKLMFYLVLLLGLLLWGLVILDGQRRKAEV